MNLQRAGISFGNVCPDSAKLEWRSNKELASSTASHFENVGEGTPIPIASAHRKQKCEGEPSTYRSRLQAFTYLSKPNVEMLQKTLDIDL